MGKGRLQGIYDMVGFDSKKSTIKDAIDEQKFKEHIKMNSGNFCKRNKDKFEEHEECKTNCIRYNPCPICDKCLNKSSNLYVKCQECKIPMCIHKYDDRKFMIRRNNFRIPSSKIIKENILKLETN